MNTVHNPADFSSRGLTFTDQDKINVWLREPKELHCSEPAEVPRSDEFSIVESDPEVKSKVCNMAIKQASHDIVSFLESRIYSWKRMHRVISCVEVH